MPKFEIIDDINQINLEPNWVSFKSHDRFVNDKGERVSVYHTGRKYRLISKKERYFSKLECLGRKFLGTLIVICFLLTPLFFKSIRNLFTKTHVSKRFGVLDSSLIALNQPITGLLIKEINFKVFSYLNAVELGRCLGVNQAWHLLAKSEDLWKNLPPPTVTAFDKNSWANFGDIGQIPLLPLDIHQTLKRPCPYYLNKKIEDTHLLILIPEKINDKPLTLNALKIVILNKFPEINISMPNNEINSHPFSKTQWILINQVNLLYKTRSYLSCISRIIYLNKKNKRVYESPTKLEKTIIDIILFAHHCLISPNSDRMTLFIR